MIYMLWNGFYMIWEIRLWVFFDTFTKVRTCGQHPGMMSMVGVGWVFFMYLVFYMFQSILNIFVLFCFFWLEKLIIFMDWGAPPPPFAEHSTKIINLILNPSLTLFFKILLQIQKSSQVLLPRSAKLNRAWVGFIPGWSNHPPQPPRKVFFSSWANLVCRNEQSR